MEEDLIAIRATGWGGVMIYDVGGKEWMGCLLGPGPYFKPNRSTNCWNYLPSPAAVVAKLRMTAEQVKPTSAEDKS